MLFSKPLEFVDLFVADLNEAIAEYKPGQELSSIQKRWLCFCIMGILITHSVCWARFERASLGSYSVAALSWMFRHSKIPWEMLLVVSVRLILRRYGISEGILAIDDTDKKRSKSTRKIHKVFKIAKPLCRPKSMRTIIFSSHGHTLANPPFIQCLPP